jgi:hypothetical protein
MTFPRLATLCIGLMAMLGALGLIVWAAYLEALTPCTGNAECMGSAATFVVVALPLLLIGGVLVVTGRRSWVVR